MVISYKYGTRKRRSHFFFIEFLMQKEVLKDIFQVQLFIYKTLIVYFRKWFVRRQNLVNKKKKKTFCQ